MRAGLSPTGLCEPADYNWDDDPLAPGVHGTVVRVEHDGDGDWVCIDRSALTTAPAKSGCMIPLACSILRLNRGMLRNMQQQQSSIQGSSQVFKSSDHTSETARWCVQKRTLGAARLVSSRTSSSLVSNHLKVFTDVSRSGDGEQSKDKSKTIPTI